MEILFHPLLPEDMRPEILGHCARSVLSVLALVNKEWAALARVYLERELTKGLRYNVQDDRSTLNWVGTYTFGSSFVHGTRMSTTPAHGVALLRNGRVVNPREDWDADGCDDMAQWIQKRYDKCCVGDGHCWAIAFSNDDLLCRFNHPLDLLALHHESTDISVVTTDGEFTNLLIDVGMTQVAGGNSTVQIALRDHWARIRGQGAIYAGCTYVCFPTEVRYVIVDDRAALHDEVHRLVTLAQRRGVVFQWV